MKKDITFTISEADKQLFAKMRNAFISEEEALFFNKLKEKEKHESAFSNDLLIYECDNKDNIFLIRKYFDTYLIGKVLNDGSFAQYETTSLSEVLSLNLSECISHDKSITLLDWLRHCNYDCVKYDRNYDLI